MYDNDEVRDNDPDNDEIDADIEKIFGGGQGTYY